MSKQFKFDRNRNRVKYCPCGKKNNGRFSPLIGFEKKGHCFSCDKFFPPNNHNNYFDNGAYKYEAPKPTSYFDHQLISESGKNYKENNFIQFIKSLVGSELTKEVIKKYLIGTSKKWKGSSVFWQIDENQKARYGKIMLYNKSTGKRRYRNELEKKSPFVNSVRSILSYTNIKFKNENFNEKQCLFGLHLINETTSKSLAVVESEKTAILMSLFKPEYTWLATGGKGNFKFEFLKPIRKYKIIAFPDKSEYNLWLNTAIELEQIGFSIQVSNWMENTDYEKGSDFADVLIKEKLYTKIKNLETKKNNELIPIKVIKTSTEIILDRFISKNPNILRLIESFQLTDKYGTEIKHKSLKPTSFQQ